MLARVLSCAVIGLDGVLIEVEADISRAKPQVTVVGLPDTAVQETKERVRSAIRNSGLSFPSGRVTLSLAPGDLRKEGPAYDLPIAVGVLLATGQIAADVEDAIFIGELALNGDVRPVRGALPMVALAHNKGIKRAFVPAANAGEAALVDGVEVYGVESLKAAAAHLMGSVPLPRATAAPPSPPPGEPITDFADVVGQEHAKRALEVAAAGGHNIVMRGTPGSGKTLLARAMPSILPPLNADEAFEVTRIFSVAGLLPPGAGLVTARPFRAPHHTISNAGLIGGGSMPRPGEVTLAHRGVLFLDELPEFDPRVLEVLRQPMEDRQVTISRARLAVSFPANFMLCSALNPCSCGFFGDPERPCTCSPVSVMRYQRRISGPLLDRIDMFVDVRRVPYEKLAAAVDVKGEPSAVIAARVAKARDLQHRRFSDTVRLNADMGPGEVREFVQQQLGPGAEEVLRLAVQRLDLSARGFHRVLKLSRTIADLVGSESVEAQHVAEAVQYRERV